MLSPRVGKAAAAACCRRRILASSYLSKRRATTSRGSGSSNGFTGKTPAYTNLSSHPAVKIVAALSGVGLICALDFVAPTTYPFSDAPSETRHKTYWNDSDAAATQRNGSSGTIRQRHALKPASGGQQQYRVVIVGGGMAGLHTALALSERMKSAAGEESEILVLDAARIGQSASGKSKGLVVPGIQVPEEDLAHICRSRELSKQIYEWTYQAARRLKEDIVQKYNIECDWVDAGLIEASLHEEGEGSEDDDEEDDDGCRVMTAAEVRRMLGQPQSSTLYKWGEFDPSCSGVDPLALTLGLARILEARWRVRICEQTKVAKIEKISNKDESEDKKKQNHGPMKFTVTTESGAQVQCQHVVLCTGPDLVSRDLSKTLANAIIPVYTWMASTVPLGDSCPLQEGILEEGHDSRHDPNLNSKKVAPLCGDDFVCLNYWRRTDDGRLLFGSLADSYPTPQWLAEYRLRNAMRQVYPQLGDVPFEHVWGGYLAFPRDAVPLIGRDEGFDDASPVGVVNQPCNGGVWFATGFGGHGIVPTVMAGSILADAILGLDDDTWRVFQREFPPKYTFFPVSRLGSEAILIIYNIFDWLHIKGVPVPKLPKPW